MPHRGDGAALLISMPCSIFVPIKSLPSIGRAVFLVGCVSGCTMMTNTFQYSIADSVRMELMHEDQKFLEADETELLYVDEQDDTGEDRPRFGFGPYCPIELTHYKGVNMCRSFRIQHNCCRSVVGESMARNYLAKHCFDSSNHPTHLDKEASFRAANSEPMTTETMEDRKAYRNHCDFFSERNKAAAEERERNRDRHRASHRSRDARTQPLRRAGANLERGYRKSELEESTKGSSMACGKRERTSRRLSTVVKIAIFTFLLGSVSGRRTQSRWNTLLSYLSRRCSEVREILAALEHLHQEVQVASTGGATAVGFTVPALEKQLTEGAKAVAAKTYMHALEPRR